MGDPEPLGQGGQTGRVRKFASPGHNKLFVFVLGVDHCYVAGSSSCNHCWFLTEYDWQPSPRLATVCAWQIFCLDSPANYTEENRAKQPDTGTAALPACLTFGLFAHEMHPSSSLQCSAMLSWCCVLELELDANLI